MPPRAPRTSTAWRRLWQYIKNFIKTLIKLTDLPRKAFVGLFTKVLNPIFSALNTILTPFYNYIAAVMTTILPAAFNPFKEYTYGGEKQGLLTRFAHGGQQIQYLFKKHVYTSTPKRIRKTFQEQLLFDPTYHTIQDQHDRNDYLSKIKEEKKQNEADEKRIREYFAIYEGAMPERIPDNPDEQYRQAIGAKTWTGWVVSKFFFWWADLLYGLETFLGYPLQLLIEFMRGFGFTRSSLNKIEAEEESFMQIPEFSGEIDKEEISRQFRSNWNAVQHHEFMRKLQDAMRMDQYEEIQIEYEKKQKRLQALARRGIEPPPDDGTGPGGSMVAEDGTLKPLDDRDKRIRKISKGRNVKLLIYETEEKHRIVKYKSLWEDYWLPFWNKIKNFPIYFGALTDSLSRLLLTPFVFVLGGVDFIIGKPLRVIARFLEQNYLKFIYYPYVENIHNDIIIKRLWEPILSEPYADLVEPFIGTWLLRLKSLFFILGRNFIDDPLFFLFNVIYRISMLPGDLLYLIYLFMLKIESTLYHYLLYPMTDAAIQNHSLGKHIVESLYELWRTFIYIVGYTKPTAVFAMSIVFSSILVFVLNVVPF